MFIHCRNYHGGRLRKHLRFGPGSEKVTLVGCYWRISIPFVSSLSSVFRGPMFVAIIMIANSRKRKLQLSLEHQNSRIIERHSKAKNKINLKKKKKKKNMTDMFPARLELSTFRV